MAGQKAECDEERIDNLIGYVWTRGLLRDVKPDIIQVLLRLGREA